MVHLDEGGRGRGRARLIAPAGPLAPWVEHLSIERDQYAHGDRPWRLVPDASPYLIFTIEAGAADIRTTRCCLVGARTTYRDISIGRRRITMAARLRPGTLGPLTQRRADLFTDRGVALEDVFGRSGRSLLDRMSNEPGESALAHLEKFLEERFASQPTDGRFEKAARSAASVARLGFELGLSPRAAYRQAVERAGLTPKRMLRIMRLHRALQQANSYCKWSDIAVWSGYSDQAHLIREFCSLLGETPVVWQARSMRRFVQDKA